jgi:hypothetical protein
MNDLFEDLELTFGVRAPSSTLEGVYSVIAVGQDEIPVNFTIKLKDNNDQDIRFSVRQQWNNELTTSFRVVYPESDSLDITFDVIAIDELDVTFEVNPNNSMLGSFEILEPPRKIKDLISVADSFTRSRSDISTLNYGSMQKMVIGRLFDQDWDYNDSFVRFDNFLQTLDKLHLIEYAKLRLYYSGSFVGEPNISIYTANRMWNEYGVTHANKPISNQLISSEYIINRDERYIEFDVVDILRLWVNRAVPNYGLIIKTDEDISLQFYTREGQKPPKIVVQYITNEVYSVGRADIDVTLDIISTGYSERDVTFEINNYFDEDEFDTTFFVHRYDTPYLEDLAVTFIINHPELPIQFRIVQNGEEELPVKFSISRYGTTEGDMDTTFLISKNWVDFEFFVFPEAFLPITFNVKREDIDDLDVGFTVSKLEHNLAFIVRVDEQEEMPVTFSVQRYANEELDVSFGVSRPELPMCFKVRQQDRSEQDIKFSVKRQDDEEQEASFTVSNPDISVMLNVRMHNDLDSYFYVKDRDDFDVTMNIHIVNELPVTFQIVHSDVQELELAVTRPELLVTFRPRVNGYEEQEVALGVRQIYADDLEITFRTKGIPRSGYYYIY